MVEVISRSDQGRQRSIERVMFTVTEGETAARQIIIIAISKLTYRTIRG